MSLSPELDTNNNESDEDFQIIQKEDDIDLLFLGYGEKIENKTIDNEFKIGDHIASPRLYGIYTHHGVYVGSNKVVHCTGEVKDGLPLLSGGSKVAYVQIDELSKFKYNSNNCYIIHRPLDINRDTFFKSIRSELGKVDYSLVNNNCEHFANKITVGEKKSNQVIKTTGYLASSLTGATGGGILKSFVIIPYIGYPVIIGGALGTLIFGVISYFIPHKST
tara:strand:+ start:14224 stop:14883 length:660 start_codon:yes stop_codon:yes gene_type:complete